MKLTAYREINSKNNRDTSSTHAFDYYGKEGHQRNECRCRGQEGCDPIDRSEYTESTNRQKDKGKYLFFNVFILLFNHGIEIIKTS